MNFKIFLGSTSKAMADREIKENTKILKFEYVKNENSSLNEIKSIFHSF